MTLYAFAIQMGWYSVLPRLYATTDCCVKKVLIGVTWVDIESTQSRLWPLSWRDSQTGE